MSNCLNCQTKLPPRKRGRPQRFCSPKCRVSLHRWKVSGGTTGMKRNGLISSTKTNGCEAKSASLPLSVLGPRYLWGGMAVDPATLETIRRKEIGPL